MGNTGNKIYGTLVEIDNETGLPTGNTKPNTPGDPDYIPPILDLVHCPTTTTTTVLMDTIQVKIKNNSIVFVNFSELKIKWPISGVEIFSFSGLVGPGSSVDGTIAPVAESNVNVLLSCGSSSEPYLLDFKCKDSVGMTEISVVDMLLATPIVGATFSQTISPTGANIYTITIEDGEFSTTSSTTTTTSTTTSTSTTTTSSTTTTTTILPSTSAKVSVAVASDVNSATSITRITIVDEATSLVVVDTAVALDNSTAPFIYDPVALGSYTVSIFVEDVIDDNSLTLNNDFEQLLDIDAGVREYTYTGVELNISNLEASILLINSTGEVELTYARIEEVERKTFGYIAENQVIEETRATYKVEFFSDSSGQNPKQLTNNMHLRLQAHYEENVSQYSEDGFEQIEVNSGVTEVMFELTVAVKDFDYTQQVPLVSDATYTYQLIQANNYRVIQ